MSQYQDQNEKQKREVLKGEKIEVQEELTRVEEKVNELSNYLNELEDRFSLVLAESSSSTEEEEVKEVRDCCLAESLCEIYCLLASVYGRLESIVQRCRL